VAPNGKIDMPASPPRGVTIIISFVEFVASGDSEAFPPNPPSADSCVVVMYTSGSTGKTKGRNKDDGEQQRKDSSSLSSSDDDEVDYAAVTVA